MDVVAWLERHWQLFAAAAVPALFYAFDLILRDGFNLGARDAGADLALLAVTGTATLMLERRAATRAAALSGLALVLLVAWVASLWCLRNTGDGWAIGAMVIGALASVSFVRAAVDPAIMKS